MKKTVLLLSLILLPFMAAAQNPWGDAVIIVNNTGQELVKVTVIDRVTEMVITSEDIVIPLSNSLQIELEGVLETGITVFGFDAEGNQYSAFDINPLNDAFIFLEPTPTFYSADPVGKSDFEELRKALANSVWVQLKQSDEDWIPDPDIFISFQYTSAGELVLSATFMNADLLLTDAEFMEDDNIIVLYTESIPGEEGKIELLDIYMNFNNLPEGFAAFQFGNDEVFIFAPYHTLIDQEGEESENNG